MRRCPFDCSRASCSKQTGLADDAVRLETVEGFDETGQGRITGQGVNLEE